MNGDIVYVTVRCQNKAGLLNQKSSDGVAILISGPSVESASINIATPSETRYGTVNYVQSITTESLLSISGFYDPIGVDYYQVCTKISTFRSTCELFMT